MPNCKIHGYYSGPFCHGLGNDKPCDNSADKAGYREFNGDRALGQNQYACRYIKGEHGSPNLGEGLRFQGDSSNYHSIYIHKDDYDEFHRRVKAHLDSRSQI
jgi:hypothetical protein